RQDARAVAAARADLCAVGHRRAVARRAARHHRRRDHRRRRQASRRGGAAMTAPLRQGELAEPIVVPVALAERAYDIVIGRGLLASLGRRIKALRPGARCAIVTDATVAKHHLASTEAALKAAGIEATRIVVPAGEASKSYATYQSVCEAIIAARIERGDLIVAL